MSSLAVRINQQPGPLGGPAMSLSRLTIIALAVLPGHATAQAQQFQSNYKPDDVDLKITSEGVRLVVAEYWFRIGIVNRSSKPFRNEDGAGGGEHIQITLLDADGNEPRPTGVSTWHRPSNQRS